MYDSLFKHISLRFFLSIHRYWAGSSQLDLCDQTSWIQFDLNVNLPEYLFQINPEGLYSELKTIEIYTPIYHEGTGKENIEIHNTAQPSTNTFTTNFNLREKKYCKTNK